MEEPAVVEHAFSSNTQEAEAGGSCEFKTSLGYTVRPSPTMKKNTHQQKNTCMEESFILLKSEYKIEVKSVILQLYCLGSNSGSVTY
jgi:hypothetical protein